MAHDDDDGGWCEVFLFHFHPKKMKRKTSSSIGGTGCLYRLPPPPGEQVAGSAKMLSCFRKKL